MPKVNYEHLEQVRRSLKESNKTLESLVEVYGLQKNEKVKKTISKNNNSIEMLNEEYLDIKQ